MAAFQPLRALLLAVALLLGGAAGAAAPAGPYGAPHGQPQAQLPAPPHFELRRDALLLVDAAGAVLQRQPLRARQLDTRQGPFAVDGGVLALAAVLDADRGAPAVLALQPGSRRFEPWPELPAPAFDIDALCLQRDADGLPHLLLLGEDGQAEQWLLRPQGALLERRFAAVPQPGACRVDDARALLVVTEPALGVWSFDLGGEGGPVRRPLALRRPWGDLPFAPQRLIAEATGLRVLPEVPDEEAAGHRRGRLLRLPTARSPARLPSVPAKAQTDPVTSRGDAADDPAIWVHPQRPEDSLVLATNKKQGLLVYDLAGRQRQMLPVGRINNVDLRQRIRIGTGWRDLAVATQRDEHGLVLFEILPGGEVLERARLPTDLKDVYGVCAARTPDGDFEVFVNDQDGRFQHLRIDVDATGAAEPRWSARVLRRFGVASQPEGCVVDDRTRRLYLGEEDRGIWTLSARGEDAPQLEMVLPVGRWLHADVEGLAIHHGREQSWLVASSQGNSSLVVMDAAPPYRVRGAFRIGIDAARGIDGVSETDGIEIVSLPMGPDYPQGLLVVQDGQRQLPPGAQNFKYIDWREVARALNLAP